MNQSAAIGRLGIGERIGVWLMSLERERTGASARPFCFVSVVVPELLVNKLTWLAATVNAGSESDSMTVDSMLGLALDPIPGALATVIFLA